MQYTLVRTDFFSGSKCDDCNRPMASGKARVVVDEEGKELYVGPTCAKKMAINGKDKVPDLTTAALDPEALGGGGRAGKGGSLAGASSSQVDDGDRLKAESYLLLRTEKLTKYSGMSYGRLVEVYGRYLADGLSDDDVKYLSNLMAKVQSERPEYSYKNLQAIYACDFWIQRFLTKDPSDFILSLKAYLNLHLALTPGQIDGLNKWFKNTPGMISIKPDAFAFDPSKK